MVFGSLQSTMNDVMSFIAFVVGYCYKTNMKTLIDQELHCRLGSNP